MPSANVSYTIPFAAVGGESKNGGALRTVDQTSLPEPAEKAVKTPDELATNNLLLSYAAAAKNSCWHGIATGPQSI